MVRWVACHFLQHWTCLFVIIIILLSHRRFVFIRYLITKNNPNSGSDLQQTCQIISFHLLLLVHTFSNLFLLCFFVFFSSLLAYNADLFTPRTWTQWNWPHGFILHGIPSWFRFEHNIMRVRCVWWVLFDEFTRFLYWFRDKPSRENL